MLALYTDKVHIVVSLWGKGQEPKRVSKLLPSFSVLFAALAPGPAFDPIPELRVAIVPKIDAVFNTVADSATVCANCPRQRTTWERRYVMTTAWASVPGTIPESIIAGLDVMPSCGSWMCALVMRAELDEHRKTFSATVEDNVSATTKDKQFADSHTIDVCVVCARVEKLLKCSKCQYTRYCSEECQTADWPQHKHLCKKVICIHPGDVGGLMSALAKLK